MASALTGLGSLIIAVSCVWLGERGFDLCHVHFSNSAQRKRHPRKSTPSVLMQHPSRIASQNMLLHPGHPSLLPTFHPQHPAQPGRGTMVTEARFPDWATSEWMNEITIPMQRTTDRADMPHNQSLSQPLHDIQTTVPSQI